MKSEKHVTLAAQIVKTINPSVGVYEFNMDDLKEAIVSALSQVEREALASKVVFPDDEELLKRNEKYIKANKSSKNTFDDLDFAYYHGQLDLIDELKTAPNEPEVKAQGFEMFCENYAKLIGHTPNPDGAAYKFAHKAFQAGQALQVRLPEKYTSQTLISGGYEHGYNAAIDDMRKLNGLDKE